MCSLFNRIRIICTFGDPSKILVAISITWFSTVNKFGYDEVQLLKIQAQKKLILECFCA